MQKVAATAIIRRIAPPQQPHPLLAPEGPLVVSTTVSVPSAPKDDPVCTDCGPGVLSEETGEGPVPDAGPCLAPDPPGGVAVEGPPGRRWPAAGALASPLRSTA